MQRRQRLDRGERDLRHFADTIDQQAESLAVMGNDDDARLGIERLFRQFEIATQVDHRDDLAAQIDDTQHDVRRSEEHTSELQSLMRISYAVFCLKKKN